ncbi:hypothetical protein Tco_0305369 [Tanacetum coccineum]
MTHRVLLRCDSTRDLYPVTTPSPIPHAFLTGQSIRGTKDLDIQEVKCYVAVQDFLPDLFPPLKVSKLGKHIELKPPQLMALGWDEKQRLAGAWLECPLSVGV